jgi:hypothetical protein
MLFDVTVNDSMWIIYSHERLLFSRDTPVCSHVQTTPFCPLLLSEYPMVLFTLLLVPCSSRKPLSITSSVKIAVVSGKLVKTSYELYEIFICMYLSFGSTALGYWPHAFLCMLSHLAVSCDYQYFLVCVMGRSRLNANGTSLEIPVSYDAQLLKTFGGGLLPLVQIWVAEEQVVRV